MHSNQPKVVASRVKEGWLFTGFQFASEVDAVIGRGESTT